MSAAKAPLILLALLSFLSFFSRPANAQVTFWGVQKTQFYTQTANDTAPTTPNSYSVFAFVNTTLNNDATSFSVSDTNTGASITPPLMNSVGSPTGFAGSNFYSTKSAMDSDFAPGDNYTFTAIGGNLDGQTDSLPIGSDAYPLVPYLTGTGFNDALALNPNADYTFNIGYAGTGTDTGTGFTLFDPSGNNIYEVGGVSEQSSFTLTSSFLQSLTPGATYTAELTDFNTADETTTGDFSGAQNSDGFCQSTTFNLMVVPEPSSLYLLGLGAFALVILRRRIRQS